MRNPVVTLNSNDSNLELPTTDVTGVPAGATEVLMVSGTQNINININTGSSSDIAANDDANSNMRTTEQKGFYGGTELADDNKTSRVRTN